MSVRGQAYTDKATIDTVACRAGVSRQTVSNVVHHPQRVHPDTRLRVETAIEELRYRPNRLARALQARSTKTLAYRCHEFGADENLLLDRFLHDLCRAAARRDYHIVLISPLDVAGELRDYDALYHSGAVDGFVLSGTGPGDERLRRLAADGVPFVSFGRNWDDPEATTWVDVDGASGTADAVEHFWSSGHRRIAWLGGIDAVGAAADRRTGYCRAMTALGGAVMELESLDSIDAAHRRADDALDLASPPTAFVCASDLLALGCARAADERGLKLSTDVGIMGFDDSRLAIAHDPPLSSVRQPTADVADALIDAFIVTHVERRTIEPILLPPTLIHRGST